MKYPRVLPRSGNLVMLLLFLATVPGMGVQAQDESPGRLGSPVSAEYTEPGAVKPMYTGCGGVYGVPSSNEAHEQQVVEIVNQERADGGLPPLKRVSLLDDAARYHATDMRDDDYFDHNTFDRSGGNLVEKCAWSTRIQSYYPNRVYLAENIAAGQTTPQAVMNSWMGSPDHRENILSTGAWEIGVGYRQGGGKYYRYWVQDFGRRTGVYPLIINQEAAETDSGDVSLYIYGAGTWSQMRLRNNAGSWTDWQPFQTASNWSLPCSAGEHTVWAELSSGGSPYLTSDTILLTRSFTPTLGAVPNALTFVYSIPEERLLADMLKLTPQNVVCDDPLTWGLTSEGTWFTAVPTGGTSPTSFWITPTTFSTSTVMTYTGAVTVTVTDPPETYNSPQQIDLTLRVMDAPFSCTYFPMTMSNYAPPPLALYATDPGYDSQWTLDTLLPCAYLPLSMRNYRPPPPPPLYPNDPYYDSQWALEKVDAPGAWGFSTGQGILIAVLDTGTDLDHPDLIDKVRTDIDKDYVNNDDEADDDHGHGTHVSGIAAAATDNGLGVAGLGWEAMILPLKVLRPTDDGNATGSIDHLAQAIRYAADSGAGVINMSVGGVTIPCCFCPATLQSAVDYAYARDVLLVAAAGNNQEGTAVFPANCEHVLGVAATKANDTRASFSNYGNHVSVAAPGVNIYSTLMGGGYGYKKGTSMSTPHVAGLAALVRIHYSSYTPDEIASAILDNADDLGATGWDQYYGCGRINALEALYTGAHGTSPVCLNGVGPWAADSGEARATASFVPGEILVSFKPGADVETTSLQHGASAEFLPTIQVWRLHVPPGRERGVLARLRSDPAVAHADLNYLVFAQ
jgi:subtilisin family serine protease/uncharacterized protein YkwD